MKLCICTGIDADIDNDIKVYDEEAAAEAIVKEKAEAKAEANFGATSPGGQHMDLNDFYDKVYGVTAEIPQGKVMTYGQIAFSLGSPKSSRLVGQAMYNTPAWLDVPAHRIVHSDGRLAPAGAFGGEGIQRRLLEEEGVIFKSNGCVNLKISQYKKGT